MMPTMLPPPLKDQVITTLFTSFRCFSLLFQFSFVSFKKKVRMVDSPIISVDDEIVSQGKMEVQEDPNNCNAPS
jgi:hypothetical protein